LLGSHASLERYFPWSTIIKFLIMDRDLLLGETHEKETVAPRRGQYAKSKRNQHYARCAEIKDDFGQAKLENLDYAL
jgi:hypothetical protein